MQISLLIVSFNGLSHLRPCLETLLPQLSSEDQVVLVDNGSTDGTEKYLQALGNAAIRYIRLERNAGFAEGNNVGAAQARGDWLFLLNNDTLCDPHLLAELKESIKSHPEFKIFACRMVRISDGRIDNKGIRVTTLLRAAQIGTGEEVRPEQPFEVFGASGGAMVVHRSVVEDIGLFEPEFFAYQEDVDFAIRARLAGYRCLYLPAAVIHHKGGGTSSKNRRFLLYYLQRNMELAILRNIPGSIAWKYLPGHLAYSAFQVTRCLLRGEGGTVIRAKRDALRLWKQREWSSPPIRIPLKRFERFLDGDFGPMSSTSHTVPQRVPQD